MQYDGLNRRILYLVGDDPRQYYYSADWQVLDERVQT